MLPRLHNSVGAILVQGVWRDRALYINGEPLNLPGERLQWGDTGTASQITAYKILRLFLAGHEANPLSGAFRQQVLSRWPQDDFILDINVWHWIHEQRSAGDSSYRKRYRRRR